MDIRLLNLLLLLVLLLSSSLQAQLVSENTRRSYLAALPTFVDGTNHVELLKDPSTIWYTEDEIPRAYQFDGGIHHSSYNISANRSEPFGNGNREFPWASPGGMLKGSNVTEGRLALHFLWLPKKEDGTPWPYVIFRVPARRGRVLMSYGPHTWNEPAYWSGIFPVGTVVGEILGITYKGHQYVWEIRLRIREKSEWGVSVLAPFHDEEEYLAALKELKVETSTAISKRTQTVRDRSHPVKALKTKTATVAVLRRLPNHDSTVSQLLQSPFKDILGTDWRPTTDESFHIVPNRSVLFLTGSDRTSCMNCHQHTGRHVNNFHVGRDWYGRIRGSDGIISFHPWNPRRISGNGSRVTPTLNPKLVRAGAVETYTRSKHPPSMYSTIKGLQ